MLNRALKRTAFGVFLYACHGIANPIVFARSANPMQERPAATSVVGAVLDLPAGLPKLFWMDAKSLLANAPFPSKEKPWTADEWTVATLSTVALAASFALDRRADECAFRHQTETAANSAKAIQRLGGMEGLALAGGTYIGGWLTENDRMRSLGADALVAGILARGAALPLKYLAGRGRPKEAQGVHRFFHGKGSSLPSGHSAQAFAMASVLAAHSDAVWVDCAAYGLAGLVAVSRVQRREHYLSDVTLGALIGCLVGHSVTHTNQVLRLGTQNVVELKVAPALDSKDPGVSVSIRF